MNTDGPQHSAGAGEGEAAFAGSASPEASLEHRRARGFLYSQTVVLVAAFALIVVVGLAEEVSHAVALRALSATCVVAIVTALGWGLLRLRLAPGGVVLSVLLADALVGYAVVFLAGGLTHPIAGVVLTTLLMVPIFAGRRFTWRMAMVHWLMFTVLLYLDDTGQLEGILPDRRAALPGGAGLAVAAWVAFGVACVSIPALMGQVPIDLLRSQADLADEVQRRTSALERASQRLVTANGDLTELNQELAATVDQLGIVNDAVGRTNAQLGRANSDLAQANRDLARANADLEQVNMALQRSNERLDQFNTAVSHDLRAPLQAITARAELAALAVNSDPARVGRMVDQICDSAERMARQLDELHKLSRVEDRLEVVEEVELGPLLGEIAHDLEPRIRERRVHLEVVQPLPRVMGSRALLAELFQNLVDNAVKYGGVSGPRVRVASAEAGDDWVAVAVEDDGPGIPQDQRDKVFQLFRRLSRDQKEDGLGAGLAIVRRIASVHGGSVTVEAGKHLSGARFVVRLPGLQASPVGSGASAAAVSSVSEG